MNENLYLQQIIWILRFVID